VIGVTDWWKRFAFIVYSSSRKKFVFFAIRQNDNVASSYICQLPQGKSMNYTVSSHSSE